MLSLSLPSPTQCGTPPVWLCLSIAIQHGQQKSPKASSLLLRLKASCARGADEHQCDTAGRLRSLALAASPMLLTSVLSLPSARAPPRCLRLSLPNAAQHGISVLRSRKHPLDMRPLDQRCKLALLQTGARSLRLTLLWFLAVSRNGVANDSFRIRHLVESFRVVKSSGSIEGILLFRGKPCGRPVVNDFEFLDSVP